ncbi:MAG: HlyC/CorC family transporter [Spirochaetales bacterium]|nr:HlyC/CorC family transporter [Spirochaetales bacterium]
MGEVDIYSFIVYSFFLILFLLFSAFFSGSETAFFSLNSLEREKLKSVLGRVQKKFVFDFFRSPDNLLITILTGNMIVNVFATDFFASTVSTYVCERFPFIDPEFFSIIVMIPILLLFGEMTPKNVAVRHPLAFARISILPLRVFSILFLPITRILTIIRTKILTRVPSKKDHEEEENATETLISFAMNVGHRRGLIKKFELDVLESYLEFRNKIASDVMVPRTEIIGIDSSTTIESLFTLITIKKSELVSGTFIYVYKQDYDHLVGYIDTGDLLPVKYGEKKEVLLEHLIKPFYTIPASKNLPDLLREFREHHLDVAQVIDEYGGTAGIVTFQNIVADILDYFYTSEKDTIREIGPGKYVLPGKIDTGTLEDFFNVEFSSERRTVSGMIMEHLGEIPVRGTSITISGIHFTVLKAGKTRILELEAMKGMENS